jgi:hypothetical protein
MAHLRTYYHKAAALMGVHQSYEPVFCFSILRSRWTGRHAGEDFVKFGNRSDKQVENSGNPSTHWRQGRTDYLKLASPRKTSSKTGEFIWIFPKLLLWDLHSHILLVAECRIFGKKKKNTLLCTPCLNLEHKCQNSTDRPYSPIT